MASMLKTKDWSKQTRRALSATEIVTRVAGLEGWTLSGNDDREDLPLRQLP